MAVVIDVVETWHINANPPRPDFVKPTELLLPEGSSFALSEVAYPDGEGLMIEGFDEPVVVYEGQVVLHGTITPSADLAAGETALSLELRYQACNDRTCTRPLKLTLSGNVSIGDGTAAPSAINQSVFADLEPAGPETDGELRVPRPIWAGTEFLHRTLYRALPRPSGLTVTNDTRLPHAPTGHRRLTGNRHWQLGQFASTADHRLGPHGCSRQPIRRRELADAQTSRHDARTVVHVLELGLEPLAAEGPRGRVRRGLADDVRRPAACTVDSSRQPTRGSSR